MPAVEIKPDIFWVGVNDRTIDLFEGLWPMTEAGVSYNSYLINDEKKALIDLARDTKADHYLAQIEDVTALSEIDYIIMNHLEPDHSGLIQAFRRVAPNAEIIGSKKTKQLLEKFFDVKDNVRAVDDGEELSLGKKTLKFFSAPFLHWPETMVTYEISRKILFPCDAFGGYGAIRGALFDDDCRDLAYYEREALRYYVNIVANFSARVLSAISKLKDVPIDVIAPSHGLIWRGNPGRIINLYKKWAEYAEHDAEPGVTIVYGSMYGNTEMVMNAVAQGVSKTGLPVKIFDAARQHVSFILPSLWTQKGVLVGAPTYEVSLFPPVAEVLHMAARKHIKNKTAAFFGSHGWSGGALKETKKIVEPLGWNLGDSLEWVGVPTQEELRRAEKFGRSFAERIRS
ncbi:MAG: FprA family A-type flavoprotein [Candidatus Aminicenantes bacterium]